MKRFLLWLVGVVLGVGHLSGGGDGRELCLYHRGRLPGQHRAVWHRSAGTQRLPAGRCRSSAESSIRCLPAPPPSRCRSWASLYTAHPALTLPDWASYTTLTIQNAYGSIVFVGSVSDYQSFLFPANGEYKAELSVWRVPEGGT